MVAWIDVGCSTVAELFGVVVVGWGREWEWVSE